MGRLVRAPASCCSSASMCRTMKSHGSRAMAHSRLRTTALAALACITFLVSAASAIPQAGGGQGNCLDVTLSAADGGFCIGFPQLLMPRDMSGFIKPYLPLNESQVAPSPVVNNATAFHNLMRFAVRDGFANYFQRNMQCVPAVLNGRWWKAMTCSAAIVFAKDRCGGGRQPPSVLCKPEIEEFFLTFDQSVQNPANSCPPSALDVMKKMSSESQLRQLSNPSSCVTGKDIEGPQLCGFSTMAQACGHSCTDPDFVRAVTSSASGGFEAICEQQRKSQTPEVPVVPFLQAESAQAPQAGTKSTSKTGSSFLTRKFAGMEVKYWFIGGGALVAIAVVAAAALLITRRRKRMERRKIAERAVALTSPAGGSPPKEVARLPPLQAPMPALAPTAMNNMMPPGGDPQGRQRKVDSWAAMPMRESVRPRSMAPADPVDACRVVLSYMPRLEDELEIHVGDEVMVWEEYGDGYAFGEAWDGRQGVFPIMCLAEMGGSGSPPPPVPPMPPSSNIPVPAHADMNTRAIKEGGIRETMVQPQAQRFTQYTVYSDDEDDGDMYPPQQQVGSRAHMGNPGRR